MILNRISTSQYLAYVICHVERSETSEVVLVKQMFHFVQHDNNNINYFQTCTYTKKLVDNGSKS
jgi:hypothetical protein